MKSIQVLVLSLVVALASAVAHADGGWVDNGGSLYGSTGVTSPGVATSSGFTQFQGSAFTSVGASQTFGNFAITGFASLPQAAPNGFAAVYGNVQGGAFVSHDTQFGSQTSNWTSSTANANAGNGGNASMNVNGSTSSQSFTFQPVPVPTPIPGGGKG